MTAHGFYCRDCEDVFVVSTKKAPPETTGSGAVVVSNGHKIDGHRILVFRQNNIKKEIDVACPECKQDETVIRAARDNLQRFIAPA